MPNETKKIRRPSNEAILLTSTLVLLLALIVVSVFAYTWKQEITTLEKSNETLRAQTSAFSGLSDELSSARLEKASLEAQLDSVSKELADLKAATTATPAPTAEVEVTPEPVAAE